MVETAPEQIVSLAIDAGTLQTWTAIAKGKVKTILQRSPGGLQFFPSEAADLAAGALEGLPGRNELTGIDVATKFHDRIATYIPTE